MTTSFARAVASMVFLSIACADNNSPSDDAGGGMLDDDELQEAFVDKHSECKVLLSDSAKQDPIMDDYDRCTRICIVGSSCADLRLAACGILSEPITGPNPLIECIGSCPRTPTPITDDAACADGTKIPHQLLCNGFVECADESDEANCPEYECKDGERLTFAGAECDGSPQCSDGSDEEGCPARCT